MDHSQKSFHESSDDNSPLLGFSLSLDDHKRLEIAIIRNIWNWNITAHFRILLYGARAYIWISFARFLGESSSIIIGLLLYTNYICAGFGALLIGYCVDCFTFDVTMLICAIITSIALIVECAATDFYTFAIASLICHSFFEMPVLGYVAKMLPHSSSIEYSSYTYALAASGLITGPTLGGLIGYYISYRSIFIASAIIGVLSCLFIYIAMWGKQNSFINRQLAMRSLYDDDTSVLSNEENQFPLCIDRYATVADEEGTIEMHLSIRDWILLMCTTLLYALLYSVETVFATYFVTYCNDHFNVSLLYSCLQASLLTIFFIGGMVSTPKISEFYNFGLTTITIALVGGCIVCMLFSGIALPYSDNNQYWYLLPIFGWFYGVTCMTQEIVLLHIQPKQHSGKVDGIRRFLKNAIRAVGLLAVGLLWNKDNYVWFWFVNLICFCLSLFLTLAMLMIFHFFP